MPEYEIAYNLLLADLGYFDAPLPAVQVTYLKQLLQTAAVRLADDHKVIVDPMSIDHAQLQESYAAWLYRSRDTGEDKPPMLAAMLRNVAVNRAKGERP